MAGIYLHIPFCKQACNYCNFHFSTSLRHKDALLLALHQELLLQKNYLNGEKIETIYFGGGTPSILEIDDIQRLIDKIDTLHEVIDDAEITLEANPDDLTETKVNAFRQTPINRFSIGIQSFFDEDLQFMHRAHTASEAENCVKIAQNAGFENLTIDLIYGTPTMSDERWLQNLEKAIALQTPHISSYCLTVEPKTLLEKQIKKQLLPNVSEFRATNQFLLLMDTLENAGFEHYEISNFAQPDRHARHNSNYWLGKKYLGIGPSAHAYDGVSRQYNVANNALYIKSLGENNIPFEKENLSDAQRYNEYVMTTLRTKWGSHTSEIQAFGDDFYQYFQAQIKVFLTKKQVSEQDGVFKLNKSGKLLADYIASELFWV